jgi:hypothetical protein
MLNCSDPFGNAVPLSSSCELLEHSDPYDVMGRGSGAIGAVGASQEGWLNGQYASADSSSPSQTFTIAPYSAIPHTTRAIRFEDGGQTFWIEYRTGVGLDSQWLGTETPAVAPGVLIHRVGSFHQYYDNTSELLDMTPTTSNRPGSALDAGLPVGQTWEDPLGTHAVTVNSENAGGATITITSLLGAVPNVRGDTTTQARTVLQNAGFQLGFVEEKADPKCESLGRVWTQSPGAGSQARYGSSINVSIGVKDKRTNAHSGLMSAAEGLPETPPRR